MQRLIDVLPKLFRWLTKAVGGIIGIGLILSILFVGIRYPIPWLWQHLWKILSIPIIILLLAVLGVLSYILFKGMLGLTEILALFVKNIVAYLLILITHLPLLYSQIRSDWGAALLSKLPADRGINVLENMDKNQAWNILLNIEQKSDEEFLTLLRNIDRQRLRDFLFLERFSRRYEILKRIGIEMDIGEDKKPYKTHYD